MRYLKSSVTLEEMPAFSVHLGMCAILAACQQPRRPVLQHVLQGQTTRCGVFPKVRSQAQWSSWEPCKKSHLGDSQIVLSCVPAGTGLCLVCHLP